MIIDKPISEGAMKVYEALVVMTEASAQDVAKKTSISRTNVYNHLNVLMELGLVDRVAVNDRQLYRAVDPAIFNTHLERERKKVAALSALFHNNADMRGRRHIQVIEGVHQIERLYFDICGSNSVVSWFGVGDAAPVLSQIAYQLADYVRENKLTFKDIIPNDKRALAYAKKMRNLKGPTYSYRVLPGGGLENDILVYDSKIAFIRLHENDFYATIIDDPSFADTFRAMFNHMWRSLPNPKGASL